MREGGCCAIGNTVQIFQALATFTIHGMAKRSVTMPKPADQKVAANGMVMMPPVARASNTRWPSAALSTPMEIHMPCGF